ncbi:histone demethylase JARID1 [Cryptococcus wingfieldii CBS 7118]|uniref:[histone H3]-trimethyl-L-lysine(4) demethylase n=1 Tax=Cryptococcus wingfieldii CBS 7118 TaxID=1295528 RepID=A0A1E3J8L8_9TREE|nr:histone demethylase JARID1 [Cryptococcus wingfieldii CBS 7118]ODN96426.1 histone demethylase JARID1 [Cryptococcus wingfieldii CBS 7118]
MRAALQSHIAAAQSVTNPSPCSPLASPTPVARATRTRPTNSQNNSPTSETVRRGQKTFTTSMHFPKSHQPGLAGSTGLPLYEKVQGRNQRTSKIQALNKIDRSATPSDLPDSGLSGTSFMPSDTQNDATPPVAPSHLRNPLFRSKSANPLFSTDDVRTKAPRQPESRSESRLFGLEECPTFYPTHEEFKDTTAYIDSIAEEGKRYGICKIIPPEGWRMPFRLETDTFKFKSRLQRLNQLEAVSRAKINFLEQLSMFHMQQGDAKVHIPLIDRQPLDLWKLRREVNKSGGHLELDRAKGWSALADTLGLNPSWTPHIRAAYMSIVLPFDNWAVRAKTSLSPLVKRPIGVDVSPSKPPNFGAGRTPSSSPKGSPIKSRPNNYSSPIAPCIPLKSVDHGFVDAALPPPMPSPTKKSKMNFGTASMSSRVPKPTNAGPAPFASQFNVPGFSKEDGSESELSDEDAAMSSPRIDNESFQEAYQKGEVCEICQSGHAAEKILLCDGCDRGFHIYCLDPPLVAVPTNEEWFCNACLLSQGEDFGFEEGDEHSIASFQARDQSFAHYWWNRRKGHQIHPITTEKDTNDETVKPRRFGKVLVSEDDVEREFWRLIESSLDTVDVEYGADIHSSTHGSAGPTLETFPQDPYAKDPWNLNNMPILKDSLLRYIKSDISGMTVPWIYIGMMFSAFCWHNEDHYTYSVNYMYWGETKTWYGVPGGDADKFEDAMKAEAPDLFEQQPGLLFQLITMMNPGRLDQAGVKVVACDQRPNEFIVTFPKAYHCGFNHGVNMNEAVNFALPDWLSAGKDSVRRYREHSKAPVFSHNELLITITLYSDTIKTATWLKDALKEMVEEEFSRRQKLRLQISELPEVLVEEDGPEEQYQCAFCKCFCYLAQMTCPCTKSVSCLVHADQLCSCPTGRKVLRMRYTDVQLEEIRDVVVGRAALPQQWHAKFMGLMSNPRPQLKALRGLAADGEKINHDLPLLPALRGFVEAAGGIMDQIATIVGRKNTVRRRRDKRPRDEVENPEEDMVNRDPKLLAELLEQVNSLAFDAPELPKLRQLMLTIQSFRENAAAVLSDPNIWADRQVAKNTLILGQSLGLDFPELPALERIVRKGDWFDSLEGDADDGRHEYKDVVALIEQSVECAIPPDHPMVVQLKNRKLDGKLWLDSAAELLTSPQIGIRNLTELIDKRQHVPISIDVLLSLESLRKSVISWQTSARNALAGEISLSAASRLCKNAASAQAPLKQVYIPELTQLQSELSHHAKWTQEASKVLGVPVGRVASTIEYIRSEIHNNLAPDDDWPRTSGKVCFCRSLPGPVMVQCQICCHDYHPQCVDALARNVSDGFKCAMCQRLPNDDGPSLNAFVELVSPQRWNFVLLPSEFETAQQICAAALRYIPELIEIMNPLDFAQPTMDIDRLRHAIRKIYTAPLVFDAFLADRNERCVFVNWLFRRMQDAVRGKVVHDAGAADSSDMAVSAVARARPRRKPRLVLAESRPHELSCVCGKSNLEVDKRTIACSKCGQGYHRRCVWAGDDLQNSLWRCPCCSVKEAKYYQKGVDLRVQLTCMLSF